MNHALHTHACNTSSARKITNLRPNLEQHRIKSLVRQEIFDPGIEPTSRVQQMTSHCSADLFTVARTQLGVLVRSSRQAGWLGRLVRVMDQLVHHLR